MSETVVLLGIPAIAIALAILLVMGVALAAHRAGLAPAARRRHVVASALGVAAFMTAIAGLALSGVLGRFDQRPPPLMLWMASTLGLSLAVGLSSFGRHLAEHLPFTALVGFQAFRLPLELLMHVAAERGIMPKVMSYSGYNFDIVSGASALVMAALLARGQASRALVAAWNVLGSLLLAAIVVIAFLATPLVRAFGDDQLNVWITQFPYVWMAVMVGSALLGHVLVARKLAHEARAPSAARANLSV